MSSPHPGWAPPSWAAGSSADAGPVVPRPASPVDDLAPVVDRTTLIIDIDPTSAAAMVVTERGSWLVPDPARGEGRWSRRPGEAGTEFLATVRSAAAHRLASLGESVAPECAVVTIPAAAPDALRRRLVEAGELAGFTGVELVPAAAVAVWAPNLPVRTGDLVLVYEIAGHPATGYDATGYGGPGSNGAGYGPGPNGPGYEPDGRAPDSGATVTVTVVRAGEGLSEVLGHDATADALPYGPGDRLGGAPGGLDRALALGQDLLARLGLGRTQVSWVVLVGEGARTPGLAARIEHGLGIPVATVDEPELAVIRGAAAWLPRSGPRRVRARGSTQRLVPLAYTIPGYTARLLRWLVEPRRPYPAGTAVARVRLASGAVWDLTVRTPGVLDEVLVPAGREVRSGEWLALVRPA